MSITPERVAQIAKLARLELDDEKSACLQASLKIFLHTWTP